MATMPRSFEVEQEEKAAAQWETLGRQLQLKDSPGGRGDIRSLVRQLATEYGVDPTFATAIAQVESNFQPHLTSNAGAQGVMQLMPGTGQRFGVRDPFDPEQNIRGGLKYLAALQAMFPGRRDLQMAAYNAGEGAVQQYGKTVPPYPETQQYVQKVQGLLQQAAGPVQLASGTGGIVPDASAGPSARISSGTGGIVPGPPTATPPAAPGATQPFSPPPRPALDASPLPDMVAAGPQPEAPWTPARKPMEPGLQDPIGPAFLASLGVGAAKSAASLLETPNTAARMLGFRDMGNIGNAAEAIGQFLRESVAKPVAPRGEQPETLMKIAEGGGAAVPLIIPGIAAERGIMAIVSQAPRIAAAFGAATSGVLQGAVSMNDTYQSLVPLVGETEAGTRAQKAFWLNTMLGAVGSQLGIFNTRVPEGLARVIAGATSQGVQGAISYDIGQSLFWVPKDNPNTPALVAQGWEAQGDRVVQPYRFKDQLEAALVQTVVGAAFAGVHELARLPMPEALKPFETDPGFTVEKAVQAAISPDAPPAEVPLPLWQRWAKGVLDLLPEPNLGEGSALGEGLLQRILGSERGSLSPERLRLRKEYGEAQRDINALGEGGDRAKEVMRRMGVDSPDAAYERARAQEAQATEGLRQLPPEDATLPPATPGPAEGPVPGSEDPLALPGAPPTTQVPAEGETQPPHRDASGRLRRNLEGIHTQELEVQEAIKQHDENGRWGIKLTGERELSDEFLSLIRPTSRGDQPSFTPGIQVRGLLNNKSGLTVQEMAERLHGHGFLQTADKQALLHVLQRSIVDGHKMYSANATGRISALDNPLVAAAEEHAREAIQSLDARTELQRRGTQSHATLLAESESMVQMGLWEPADLPAMVPGTTLDAASLGAVVLSVSKVGEQLQQQALRVVETGGRPGSAEVGDFFEILAHMAQIDPARVGAIAEPARATGYMNAPMSAYNRFLNELHAVMATHGDQTALTMARQYLAIATPEERLALSVAATAEAERMRTGPWESSASPLMEGPGGPAIRGEGEQQALLTLPEFEALRAKPAGELDAYLGGLFEHNYGPGLPEELQQRVTREARIAQAHSTEDWLAKMYRDSGQIAEGELFRQRQAEDPFSTINDPTVEQPSLFGPTAMRPHRDAEMLAKQRDIFFAKVRAASGLPPEGERFQTYRPREGVHHPLDEGTPLMLDARQSVQPGFEERVRVWHEKLTRQAMEETDPMTRQALLGELKVQHDGIWQQYHATVASRTHIQAEIDAAQSRLRVAQAGMMHTRPGFAEMLTEQTTAAMLGPTSWIKNETGNTGMGIWGLGTRFLAEQIGRLHPETGMVPGETAADLYAATHGLVEHFRAASRYWHGGESQFAIGSGGESGKTDVYRKAVTTENVNALFGTQMDPDGIAGKVLDFWAEYVGFLSGGRFTHRVMNTRDEFYKSWNASRESNALAWREAVRQGIAEGSAFADHTALIRSDPNLAAEIRQEALGQALEMTLQDPAKPGGVADKFTQLSNWRIHIPGTEEQELPVGRLLNPFIKIPANGIKRQIENSPLAALGADWRKTMAEGGVKADRQLAKVIMGSGLMASIAMYVGTGNVTGRAPDNPVLRDAWLNEHPEYSTRVPFTDVWLPYRWTGPMGDQIAMVVDAAQIMGTIPDNLAKKLAVGIGYSFIKNIWNQGASKNIADFFDALSPNPGEREDSYGQRLAHWGLRQGISSFGVPLSGGLVGSWGSRAIIRAFDPEKKAAKDLLDQVWAQTPWSTNVPAHRTLNADPMLLGYGVGPETLTALVRAFSPLRPQASLAGPADKAIVANNMKLTYPSRVLDPTAVPEGSAAQVAVDYRTLQPLVLTGRQYERLQSLAALNEDRAKELFPPSEGPIIPLALLRQVTQGVAKATIGRPPPSAAMSVGDMMDWIATQPEFTDDMRSSPGPRGGKAQKLSLAVAEYRKVGTQLFLELDPSQVGERLRQSKIQHALEQLPVPQQGIMRPMLEQSYRQGRHSARSSMGLPPLPVGAQ